MYSSPTHALSGTNMQLQNESHLQPICSLIHVLQDETLNMAKFGWQTAPILG